MIRLSASLTKKVPHPQHEYGSIAASLSLEVECPVGQDPAHESQRLFRELDQAIEAELQRQVGGPHPAAATPGSQPGGRPTGSSGGPNPAPSTSGSSPQATGRRPPSPISAAQLRFLRQLVDRTPGALERILADHRVATLEDLTSRAASGVIDRLKAPLP